MIAVTFRPLVTWPGKATAPMFRKGRLQFKASWTATLDLLERELDMIGARDVVIQLAVTEREIRNDGWPRGDATPAHPGIVLNFTHPAVGPVRYFTDVYELWQHNVRAIALGLQALRAVDRYGITQRGEQYAGWKAIAATSSTTMTAEQAAEPLGRYVNARAVALLHGPSAVANATAAIRAARAKSHPDAGGTADAFAAVGTAKAILEAHHGRAL